MMIVNPLDRIILDHAPLLAVPRFEELPPLEGNGHRFLVSQDGVWLELRRPWLHLLWPVAISELPLPYGELPADSIEYAWPQEETDRFERLFIADARAALPNECAAWGVWNEITRTLEYRPLISIAASSGSVTFHRPQLAEGEHLAIDIHSHGALAAFFSATDDDDDAGAVKLAMVVGNLDSDEPTVAYRLCALGLLIDYGRKTPGVCRRCGCTDETPCEGGCAWIEPDLCSRCA